MQIFSAFDSILPAFSRTRLVLFSPFRAGRSWKLAATGYLAVAGTIFLPYMFIAFLFIPMAHRAGGLTAVYILVAITLAVTLLYLVIFYLCSRLRFAFFDIVLNRGEFVAPAWRKYGPQSLKWTLCKVVLGTLLLATIAAPCAAYARILIHLFSTLQVTPAQPPPPQVMSLIFSGYAVLFIVYLSIGIFFWLSSLLSDFIIPSLALENTSLGEAFRRLRQLIRNEPGQFAAYAFLKLALAVAGYFAQAIAFYAVFIILGLIVGLIAFLMGLLLHALGVSAVVLTGLGIFVGVVFYFFIVFYCMFFVIGTVATFLESYTLYFLGGRYPMLGDLLAASTPLPPPPPPESLYPAFATVPPPPDVL